MNETELIKIADALSTKSDRWMFIATLAILLAVGVYGFRLLIRDRAEVIKDYREDRNMFQSALREIIKQQAEANASFKQAIEENTSISRENNMLIRTLKERVS